MPLPLPAAEDATGVSVRVTLPVAEAVAQKLAERVLTAVLTRGVALTQLLAVRVPAMEVAAGEPLLQAELLLLAAGELTMGVSVRVTETVKVALRQAEEERERTALVARGVPVEQGEGLRLLA